MMASITEFEDNPKVKPIRISWVFDFDNLVAKIEEFLKQFDPTLFHFDSKFIQLTESIIGSFHDADDVLIEMRKFAAEFTRIPIDLSPSYMRMNFNVKRELFEKFKDEIPKLTIIQVNELRHPFEKRYEDMEVISSELETHLNALKVILKRPIEVSSEIFELVKRIKTEIKGENRTKTISGYLTNMKKSLKDGNTKITAAKRHIQASIKKIKETADKADTVMYYLPQDLHDTFLNEPFLLTVESLHFTKNYPVLERKCQRIKACKEIINSLAETIPATRVISFDEVFLMKELSALLEENLKVLREIDFNFFEISPRTTYYLEWLLRIDASIEPRAQTQNVLPVLRNLRKFMDSLIKLTIDPSDIFETNCNYFLHILEPNRRNFGKITAEEIKTIRNEIKKATPSKEKISFLEYCRIGIQNAMEKLSAEARIILSKFMEIRTLIKNQTVHRERNILEAVQAIDQSLERANKIFKETILAEGLLGVIGAIESNLKELSKTQIELGYFLDKYYPRLPIGSN